MTQAGKTVYNLENCVFAYQLWWELDVYWKYKVHDSRWYGSLKQRLGHRGVELVKHQFMKPGWSRFRVHSRPELSPQNVVGLIQTYLREFLHGELPNAIHGSFRIQSCGSLTSQTLRDIAASAVEQELDRSGDTNVQSLQIQQLFDLSQPQSCTHGEFCYNLHIVFDMNMEQIPKIKEFLEMAHDHVMRTSQRLSYRLLQATILPHHLDLALGGPINVSPGDIALTYMNGLADACQCRPVFCFRVYIGTLGE